MVAIRVGDHCAHVLHKTLGLRATLRLSFHAYNTEEDVDVAVGAVEGFLKVLAG